MSTLTIMKERIAQEVRRKAYTSLGTADQNAITDAVTTAIEAYQDQRFHFNESRSATFSTVASQEFYDEDDDADIGNILKIDYISLVDGDQNYRLLPDFPAEIESASTNSNSTGQPGWYLYYNRKIRLYPSPNQVWTIRIAGVFLYAAPATDDEADNFWMTDAERLIRCRAKYELALHVYRDIELAQTMGSATTEAFEQLKRRTARVTQRDSGRVRPMMY